MEFPPRVAWLQALLISCAISCDALIQRNLSLEQQWIGQSRHEASPSIAVFVFSRLFDYVRRDAVRDMWIEASKTDQMKVNYKFVVCGGTDHIVDKHPNVLPAIRASSSFSGAYHASINDVSASDRQALAEEYSRFDDVVYLDCAEGYDEGKLTIRLLACMNYFWNTYKSDYFMKIDDDTFIAWSQYQKHILLEGSEYVYMGIPIGKGKPCRNAALRWYEPWSSYSKLEYPQSMAGGSGYMLGKGLVGTILHDGIGKRNMLYNEDRAVAVWVHEVNTSNPNVSYVGLKGVEGYWAWSWQTPMDNWNTWAEYPYFIHHGIEGETIRCLASVEHLQNPNASIKQCFRSEEGKTYESVTVCS